MAYIGKQPGTGVRNRFLYTATAGQTTFTTSDSNLALSYSDALYMDVYLNGVLLDPANDYTATSGTSVVLGSGATAGDILEIVVYDVFSVFNNTIDGNFEVGGNTTLDNNLTVGGDLTVDTNTLHVDSTNNRVGIGTSSPDASLHIEGSGVSALRFGNIGPSSNSAIRLSRDDITVTSGNPLGYLQFGGNDSTSNTDAAFAYVSGEASGTHGAGDNPTDLTFGTTADGSSTPAERMRITSGGAIQIGSTNSGVAGTLDVSVGSTSSSGGITLFSPTNGTHSLGFADGTSGTDRYRGYLEYQHASDAMTFGVQASEAMRIDSSPQVLMGKTVANLTTAGSLQAANATSDGSPAYFYMIKTFSGTRNAWLNYHSGTYVGGINMTNTSTSFPTSSDERLKKNIVDAPSAGDKIDAMQVRSFNWKADDSFQEYGLIAQELEPVYDLPVEQHDTEDTLTVDYSKLVPVLLKEIQDLRKRVATLENN
jgi:hypothetical protein